MRRDSMLPVEDLFDSSAVNGTIIENITRTVVD